MDFGMPFLLETVTLEQCIAVCSSLQLKFIELNMNFPQCQPDVLKEDKLRNFQEKTGLYFTIHLDENLNICDFNTDVREAYKRTVSKAIQLAKAIQIPIINMHLAKGIFITLPHKKEYLFRQYEDHYKSCLLEFREMCEGEIGVSRIKIAIENTDGFMEHEKAAIEFLLERNCFGLTLDIGHSHAVHDIDIPFYNKHIGKLVHMHAHDAKGTNNHLAFGDGEIDIKERLSIARKANARVVLETKTIEALSKTSSLLKDYLSF